ncbi:MAG: hypothetical protein JXB85_09705 [Anaerolineales bacterium]|nr:hypothetical protein [Anaerolineales bacterium]
MRKIFLTLLLGLLLTSCESNLWGSYDDLTPTASPDVFVTVDQGVTPTWTPFLPYETPTPAPTATPIPIGPTDTAYPPVLYYAQSGDCLQVVAAHFNVAPAEISSSASLPEMALIDPETPLLIPDRLRGLPLTPAEHMLPDSEIVYSPTALSFDVGAYVSSRHGYLSTYREYLLSVGWVNGAEAVQKSAIENSINPRLLLALIEYKSGWVRGQPENLAQTDYPLGRVDIQYRGLFRQMMWTTMQLSIGYYGWRGGTLTDLTFPDGTTLRLAPDLNAGTVALMYYFSLQYNYTDWLQVIDPRVGFPALYEELFGDPWIFSDMIGPLFPPALTQPEMSLPFEPGRVWSFSGGPHPAWEMQGALAAIDFAPASAEPGCLESDAWIISSIPGLVVRSAGGAVVLDLDGDGHEQTGWNLLFLHVAARDRVPLGTWVEAEGRIGHPSCEGGVATGTHVHFARKYNGEWVLADGPLPFTLSGWVVHNGSGLYLGTLTRGDEVVIARTNGIFDTQIIRQPGE